MSQSPRLGKNFTPIRPDSHVPYRQPRAWLAQEPHEIPQGFLVAVILIGLALALVVNWYIGGDIVP